MRWWNRTLTRLVAADPGVRRLRAAAQVILAVALAVGIALPALLVLGQPPTAVAPAAVVAMTSLLAVREGSTRTRVVTILLLPVAAVAAIALAVLVHGRQPLAEAVFLGVMFVAVYVRRYGPRATAAGMVAFIGYFLALFLQATPGVLAAMAGAAVTGALAAVLARFVLLPERPAGAWRAGVRALLARGRTLRHSMVALVEQPHSVQRRRRVHDELLRLNATALALGSGFEALTALPEERADELRGRVLGVELAAAGFVAALDGVLDEPGDPTAEAVLPRVAAALDNDIAEVAPRCRELADFADGFGAPVLAMGVRRLAAAAEDVAEAVAAVQVDFATRADQPEPAAEPGREPGAVAEPDTVAGPDVGEPAEAAGLRPTTRTAVQVVVAGALSIFVGGLVAPGQWFWAVITAFVVFAGAASRGELLVRAWSRSAGTIGGVLAGVLVASLVAGHPVEQVSVVLLCVFLAFYLLPVSYGLMTFFVTTMLGVLYGLLGRFSIAFLEIRLVETLIGAVAGAVAALFVLPTRTRGVVAEKLTDFCAATAQLLGDAAADLRAGSEIRSLAADARGVDDRMHALLASASPLGSFRIGDARARHARWRQLVSSSAAATREFARTLPLAAPTCDEDTRRRLGELTGGLAELAEALAERALPQTTALVERATAAEGTLIDLVEAVQAGPTALRAAVHQLGRLRGALADIAVELGAPPATATGAAQTPARTAPAR